MHGIHNRSICSSIVLLMHGMVEIMTDYLECCSVSHIRARHYFGAEEAPKAGKWKYELVQWCPEVLPRKGP